MEKPTSRRRRAETRGSVRTRGPVSESDVRDATRPAGQPSGPAAGLPRGVWAAFGLAMALRTVLALRTEVINTDGPMYIGLARVFLDEGVLRGIERSGFAPVYTGLIALGGALGLPLHVSAYGVTCLLGSLVVFPLYALARAAFDARVALLTVCLYAFLPVPARLSASLYTTAPFLFLTLSSLALSARLARAPSATCALAAGFTAALAYATRPDGLLLLPFVLAGAAVASGWRPRGRVALAVLALLPVIALVVALQQAAGTPEASPLTRKLSRAGWERFLDVLVPTTYVLKNVWEDVAESIFVPFIPFATIGFLAWAPRAGRMLRAAALALCVLWVFSFFKYAGTTGGMSKRYAAPLAVVLLPWTVQGLLLLAAGVTWATRRAAAQTPTVVVVLACAACVPKLMRTHEGDRIVEKAAGEYLRTLPEPRGPILCGSTCVPYYAEVDTRSLRIALLPPARVFPRLRREGVRYVVRDRGLVGFAPEFARSLGPPDATLVREVRLPGCKDVVEVFRVEYPGSSGD